AVEAAVDDRVALGPVELRLPAERLQQRHGVLGGAVDVRLVLRLDGDRRDLDHLLQDALVVGALTPGVGLQLLPTESGGHPVLLVFFFFFGCALREDEEGFFAAFFLGGAAGFALGAAFPFAAGAGLALSPPAAARAAARAAFLAAAAASF